MIRIFSTLAAFITAMLLASAATGLYSISVDGVHHPERSIFLLHFNLGLFTAVGTLLAHCLIFTYFLGTGRWVKEVKIAYNLPDEPWPKLTRELKRRTFPPALAAMLITIAAAATGAGVQMQGWSWIAHAVTVSLALIINLWAFYIEIRDLRINANVIVEVMSAVERVREEHGLVSNIEAINAE
jgi:hypothetical protein